VTTIIVAAVGEIKLPFQGKPRDIPKSFSLYIFRQSITIPCYVVRATGCVLRVAGYELRVLSEIRSAVCDDETRFVTR
jgi:hypothetical protein